MSPLDVGVLGATGRMGRMVIAEIARRDDLALKAAVASPSSAALGADAHALCGLPPSGVFVTARGEGCFDGCDVIIDFSLPDALSAALPYMNAAALVSGTTGLSDAHRRALDAHAARAPVLWAANFSVGVAVLRDLARRAAAALPDADVEIVEIHHRHKRDAPSGTALALAESIAAGRGAASPEIVHGRAGMTGERPRGEIGMHALRGGEIVGEHTVWLILDGERLELGHAANARTTFAAGAVRCAPLLCSRPPGRYTLTELLGL